MIWYIVENKVNNKMLLTSKLDGGLSHYKWTRENVKILEISEPTRNKAVLKMVEYIKRVASKKDRVFHLW